ncbi:hypothetical protein [Deinococcus sp. QL22]|nr:hypothetical protein [Deinococcus sp. QL22]
MDAKWPHLWHFVALGRIHPDQINTPIPASAAVQNPTSTASSIPN